MFGLSTGPFEGLTDSDFDAFDEKKWSSNRFNLERMRVRERLEGLAADALGAEPRAELGVTRSSTDDHPTVFNHRRVSEQVVYFARSEDERKRVATLIDSEHPLHQRIEDPSEYHLHAVLALSLDHERFFIRFGLHSNAWLDAKNFLARLEEPFEATRLREFLADCPEWLQVAGPGLGEGPTAAKELEVDALKTSLAELARPDNAPPQWVWFGRELSRADAIESSADLLDACRTTFERVSPLFRFASWRADNDHIGVQSRLKSEKKAARAQAGVQSGAIEPKSWVKITKGLFAGRDGEVVDLDGKGSARVTVGTIVVRMPVGDLQTKPQKPKRA